MLRKLILVLPLLFLVFVLFPVKAYAHALQGTVFIDTNSNGVQDNGEIGYANGATITAVGQAGKIYTWTTDSVGHYGDLVNILDEDTYTITLSVPSGYNVTTTNPVTLFIAPANYTVDFGIVLGLPYCTSGAISCGACTAPANTCSANNGIQTCMRNQPAPCTQVAFTRSCTVNACASGNSCLSGVCRSGYTISGSVFKDVNKNKRLDTGELNYTGSVDITITGGNVTLNPDNTYRIDGLVSGSYIISADFSPGFLKGYQLVAPKPPSFAVRVGGGNTCNVANPSTGGVCDSDGNISNLNFAVSDSLPWMQFYGLGTRFDDGIDNPLPASTTCGGGSFAHGTTVGMSSPGIAFTGDASADYGQGDVSSSRRSVGGISYPEVYSGTSPLKTSATGLRSTAVKAGYTITQLSSVTACANPDQSCNLQGRPSGFYATSGDLVIDQPLSVTSGNYVIVADGNITFGRNARITVTQGATLIIAAGRDMIVDQLVSALANACPVPAGQLQGIFSAGRNFIVNGNGGDCSQPADRMLNIDGSLIINAGLNGGTLQNNRDLCGGNASYPSLTVTSRPDFILNLPAFIFKQNVIMHEDTP